MSDNNKAKIGIHMRPELIAQVDAEHPLHGFSSRSAFVCTATKFYLGHLHSEADTEYMSKTTLSFLENQFARLDAKVCRQLFRMCVEQSMAAHIAASTAEVDDDTLKRLRVKCVKDVKNTIGNIRFDKIYAHQHPLFEDEQEVDTNEI